MRVHELAGGIGANAAEVAEFLGKNSSMAGVSEDEAEKAKIHFGNKPKPEPKSDVVRYISLKRRWMLNTPDGDIKFEDFRFPTKRGSKADKYLSKAIETVADLYILEQEPWDDDEKLAEFRGIINSQVLDTDGNIMPEYGYAFLMAMFDLDEQEEAAKVVMRSVEQAIERVLRKKRLVKSSQTAEK